MPRRQSVVPYVIENCRYCSHRTRQVAAVVLGGHHAPGLWRETTFGKVPPAAVVLGRQHAPGQWRGTTLGKVTPAAVVLGGHHAPGLWRGTALEKALVAVTFNNKNIECIRKLNETVMMNVGIMKIKREFILRNGLLSPM